MKRIVLIMLAGLLLSGCAAVRTAKPEAGAESGSADKQAASAAAAAKTDDAARQGAASPGDSVAQTEIDRATQEGLNRSFAGTDGQSFNDIYFDYDSYAIKDAHKPILMKVSDVLIRTGGRLVIEGHCDERGTNEYNIALGDRRAAAAKEFLVSSGIAAGSIETVSFGEERPQCKEGTESCWQRNRRAHFSAK